MDAADTLQITEIHPDEERFAYDILVRHKSPKPAIRAVVTVITHHEIIAFRNDTGKFVV